MTANKWNIKLQRSSHLSWQPEKQADKRIAVLMSGGVDSSTAAYLLKQQGWDVLGITMKVPLSTNVGKRTCCGTDAAFVCEQLAIPHYFVDVTEVFEEIIIKPFRQSYTGGQTPNPCVDCNTFLKFSLLWDFLQEKFGTIFLATGHYAKVYQIDDRFYLGKAKDIAKDQSYFLYGISSQRLPNLVLPLGEFTKEQVRAIAADAGLPVAEKSESMELCFAGEGDYRTVLTDAAFNRPGDITDMKGNKIAEHKGIANFTLGQRKGIGFAGGIPLYVGKIDAQKNTIALGTKEQVSFRSVITNQLNVLIPEELVVGGQFFGKVRSYVDSHPCRLVAVNKQTMTVKFDQPQFAPCPGQRLVLYNNRGYITAGGTII
ncbi:MAG: tRNA 2-thiouridine(34) synthase MnmA [Phycisphaerae bacterium]|nr:tRNA 2-thiouridine(34) synthase MnmA [Phycisphaerae bacterium]MDD5381932.1 tRNA 2-thiouridine(34) synthase MnmA [Phycisphaerae bacterium]